MNQKDNPIKIKIALYHTAIKVARNVFPLQKYFRDALRNKRNKQNMNFCARLLPNY